MIMSTMFHIMSLYCTLDPWYPAGQRVVIIVIHWETVIQRERGRFNQTEQNRAEREGGWSCAPHEPLLSVSPREVDELWGLIATGRKDFLWRSAPQPTFNNVPYCTAAELILNIKRFILTLCVLRVHYDITVNYSATVSKCNGSESRDTGRICERWRSGMGASVIWGTMVAPESAGFCWGGESLKDPLSADGGVFAGQRQLGQL